MSSSHRTATCVIAIVALAAGVVWMSAKAAEGQFGTPKDTEGTRIFKATEHPYYSGEFHLAGGRATLVGSMSDSITLGSSRLRRKASHSSQGDD